MSEELEGGFPKPCKHDLVDLIAWHVNNGRKPDAQALLTEFENRVYKWGQEDNYYTRLAAKVETLKEFQDKMNSPCETCHDNAEICASIPGVRHCEKANRE